MNHTVGKIEFGNNVLVKTPQVCWMFDPEGSILIERAQCGYLLREFTDGEDGYKIAMPPRFVEVKNAEIGGMDWLGVRDLLYEVLDILELWGSKHHDTHLDISVIDNEGKRIDGSD